MCFKAGLKKIPGSKNEYYVGCFYPKRKSNSLTLIILILIAISAMDTPERSYTIIMV